jgi:MFS family permease
MQAGLRWYLGSTALFLVPSGIQMVLYPWLVAIYLHESPERVGIAAMASQIPMLLLILWGGLIGDRFDQKRLLVRLQIGMTIPPLIMAYLAFHEQLTFGLLFAWAMVGGTFAAFVQPTRDALLNRVAGDEVQRVVTLAIGVQFGVQIIGFAIGSLAATTGVPILLVTQSLFFVAATIATHKIPLAPVAAKPRSSTSAFAAIAEGVSIAWRSPGIRPAVIQVFAVGMFFAGTYIVLLPLMVRDIYQGSSVGIALAFAANMLGTITSIFFMMRKDRVQRPGRLLICGSLISLSVLSLLMLPLPLWGFYFVVYLWGACGGVSMAMSRSIVQELSPATHRARLMSVYSMGMMGGMPIGSLLLGWCVGNFGVREAVLVPVLGMLVVTLGLAFATQLWQIKSEPSLSPSPA